MNTNIPTLQTYRTPAGSLAVWCDHCGCLHYHDGAGGHRVAHCRRSDAPYQTTGYVLAVVGDLPAQLARGNRRRDRR